MDCIVVEDSLPGVRAAMAAGLPVIALSSQVPAHLFSALGADYIVETFAEVADVIERVMLEREEFRIESVAEV